MSKQPNAMDGNKPPNLPLSFFACPNGDCADFNRFDAGNLSVAEWMGKDKGIHRLYCKTCGTRFSERQGSLMQETKLPEADVVRIVKCRGHGCSVEATADICEGDTRTVQRLLERAGKRAADFHRRQLERLDAPLDAVQMDELHGKTGKPKKAKRGVVKVPKKLRKRLGKKGQDGASYGSHREKRLQYSIWLWRDLYNWARVHYSLWDETPAMALGLTHDVWTVRKYIGYPVHVSVFQRLDWAERRNSVLESAIEVYKRKKALPIS